MPTAASLGPAISQKDPLLRPGDIDDCWVVAAIQAAAAVGGVSTDVNRISMFGHVIPTIPAFRSHAGRPDVQGQTNGGTNADVLKGSLGEWPHLQIVRAPSAWSTFRAKVVREHQVFAVAVLSAKLPAALQFGFRGLHEISGRYVTDTPTGNYWYVVNPLQPKGSAPLKIMDADLKAAILGGGGGYVSGVLFAPAIPVAIPAPAPAPVPAPIPAPAPAPVPAPVPIITQADLTAANLAGFAQGEAVGIAATKAAARIVYE